MDASIDTTAVHAGRHDLTALGVHALPIDLSSTNPLSGIAEGGDSYENLALGGRLEPGESAVYQRLWNPTVARLESAVAELEGTADAIAFASGMAALTAVLIDAVRRGTPHVVAVRPLYGGSDHLLGTGMVGTSVTFVHPEEVAAAIRADTGLVILESPANPTLELVDIRSVVEAAGGVPVLVDNTFATPVLQRPHELGATWVLHSATKFIGGHSDALGGLVAADEHRIVALRQVRALTGGILNPMAAYLLHRGLPTLPLRVRDPAGDRHRTGPAPRRALRDRASPASEPARPRPAGACRHPDGRTGVDPLVRAARGVRGSQRRGRRSAADHPRRLAGRRGHPHSAPRGPDPPPRAPRVPTQRRPAAASRPAWSPSTT